MNDRRHGDRRRRDSSIVRKPRRNTQRRVDERRSERRVDVDLWLEQQQGDEVSYRYAGNLSAGGVRLVTGVSYPEGTRVNLRFSLAEDEQPIETPAEVVQVAWEGGKSQTSLRFLDLGGEDHDRIRAFIEKKGG